MPSFEQGQIVRVPFPYADRSARQHRPALVVSQGPIGDGAGFLWVAMITSAEHRRWPEDHRITDLASAGLPIASVVRAAKITTIEARDAEPIGKLSEALMSRVLATILHLMGGK